MNQSVLAGMSMARNDVQKALAALRTPMHMMDRVEIEAHLEAASHTLSVQIGHLANVSDESSSGSDLQKPIEPYGFEPFPALRNPNECVLVHPPLKRRALPPFIHNVAHTHDKGSGKGGMGGTGGKGKAGMGATSTTDLTGDA